MTSTLHKSFLFILLPLWCVPAQAGSVFECLVEPNQTIDVRAPVSGRLEAVHVSRGDKIVRGQDIAALESSAEQAAVALARHKAEALGPILTAERKVEFTTRKFQRHRAMQAQDFMSTQERDDAEAEMKLAEAELHVARENKELARLEWQQQKALLDLRTLRSPFSGVVTEQVLYPGEVVNPADSEKPILKLAQLDPLRVQVILPLTEFGRIKSGMAASITLEELVGGRYTGHVNTVDRVVNAASGTFVAFLEVRNPALNIPAGLKCRANFPLRARSGNTSAPLPR